MYVLVRSHMREVSARQQEIHKEYWALGEWSIHNNLRKQILHAEHRANIAKIRNMMDFIRPYE